MRFGHQRKFTRLFSAMLLTASILTLSAKAEGTANYESLFCHVERDILTIRAMAHRWPDAIADMYGDESAKVLLELDESVRLYAAWELLEIAAFRGEVYAQRLLGSSFLVGDLGLVENDKKGLEWSLRAANQGDRDAQLTTALSLMVEEAIQPDPKRAYKWFLIARSNPSEFNSSAYAENVTDESFAAMASEITMRLSQSDIKAAQDEAAAWVARAVPDPCFD